MFRKKIIYISVMIIFSVVLILLNKKSYSNEALTKEGFYFDTYISVTIYDSESNYSENINQKKDIYNLLDECLNICRKYEKIFSPTDENSTLYQLNNNEAFLNGTVFEIPEELAECIDETLNITDIFSTKYSVLSGEICSLWNYEKKIVPDEYSIKNALVLIDSYNLVLNGNKIQLRFELTEFNKALKKYNFSERDISYTPPSINLGASAKGYISDKICEFLKKNGIKDAIINLGGNIVVIGNKYDNSMYKIGIKKPFSNNGDNSAVCKIADMAMVTSGIYERYFMDNDIIYHHIIDCSTGYPVDNSILSVTVIAKNGLYADCFSTGCLLMGKDDALKLINDTKEVECVIIDSDYNIYLSDGLRYDGEYIVMK